MYSHIHTFTHTLSYTYTRIHTYPHILTYTHILFSPPETVVTISWSSTYETEEDLFSFNLRLFVWISTSHWSSRTICWLSALVSQSHSFGFLFVLGLIDGTYSSSLLLVTLHQVSLRPLFVMDDVPEKRSYVNVPVGPTRLPRFSLVTCLLESPTKPSLTRLSLFLDVYESSCKEW